MNMNMKTIKLLNLLEGGGEGGKRGVLTYEEVEGAIFRMIHCFRTIRRFSTG